MTSQGTLVLNVTEHDGVQSMTSNVLAHAGFNVVNASTGAEALELVEKLRPRLVVLDVELPDIDGLAVCRQLKMNPCTQSVKILHTSAAFVAPEFKVQSLNSGADGYLSHPFEQEELIATVRSLLRLADAEQQLRDTAAQLQQSNQRTHEFLAMLAHELRNPLSAIATCTPLLERMPPRDDVEKSVWQILRRQTDNLRRLVEDLLDTARVTQGRIDPKWEVIDLVALLRRVTDGARRSLTNAREQTLVAHLPPEQLLVRADSLRLEQVFSNLFDNASKYMDGGGRIDVHLESGPTEVTVIIKDTGIGIPLESLGTIFNLFFQAEMPASRSRTGLGIGLTLVRTLVELHGGTVLARSDGVGKGSEIEVRLPVVDGQAASTTQPNPVMPMGAAAGCKVLVVEDNLDAQNMLRLLLELWGHEVLVASDGAAGIEAISTHDPDVALVDIGLPVIDGYALARHVRSRPPGRKLLLVALTGYGGPDQRARALEAGFDLHLVKPVEPEQLAQVIAQERQ